MKQQTSSGGVVLLCAICFAVGGITMGELSSNLKRDASEKDEKIRRLYSLTASLSDKNFYLHQQLRRRELGEAATIDHVEAIPIFVPKTIPISTVRHFHRAKRNPLGLWAFWRRPSPPSYVPAEADSAVSHPESKTRGGTQATPSVPIAGEGNGATAGKDSGVGAGTSTPLTAPPKDILFDLDRKNLAP